MRLAFLGSIALGALIAGAPAFAQDNPACAKFEEPLAYNACLARLGPHAHAARGVAAPEEEGGEPAAGGRRRAHGGYALSQGRRGRARMEFDVGRRKRGGDE